MGALAGAAAGVVVGWPVAGAAVGAVAGALVAALPGGLVGAAAFVAAVGEAGAAAGAHAISAALRIATAGAIRRGRHVQKVAIRSPLDTRDALATKARVRGVTTPVAATRLIEQYNAYSQPATR